MSTPWEQTRHRFNTTYWALVGDASADDPEARDRALADLTRTYWPAIYAWARRRGMHADAAAEFTQDFFSEKIVAGGLFAKADAKRGKLRSLILQAAKNFEIDRHRRRVSRREHDAIPIDAFQREEAILGGASGDDAEAIFERRWMLSALDEALDRARVHYTGLGKCAHWEAFEQRVLAPARSGVSSPSNESLARDLGFATPADVSAAIQVVKKRVIALLREVIAESLSEEEELDREFNAAIGLFA